MTRAAAVSGNPYEDMTDEQVLAGAAGALRKVTTFPVGSLQRAIQWGVYESAKSELDRRMFIMVVAQIREMNGE